MLADAAVSGGVVIAGLAILMSGWNWIDPLASLVISGVIVWSTWGLLRGSLNMSLQAVPSGIEPGNVRSYLERLPGVAEVHDLHIWPMSTTETALTAHLVRDVSDCDCALLEEASNYLHQKFEIQHATIQFETTDHECHLAPDERV